MLNTTENLLSRITLNKEILGGKPIIRGMRISVAMILELLAKGATMQEILEDYPELEMADIHAALLYAHHLVENEEVKSTQCRDAKFTCGTLRERVSTFRHFLQFI